MIVLHGRRPPSGGSIDQLVIGRRRTSPFRTPRDGRFQPAVAVVRAERGTRVGDVRNRTRVGDRGGHTFRLM